MDPAPETIRAVRDKRYKYVRNYRPELPYFGFIPYRDRAAMMQEVWKLMEENALGPNQWQFWAKHKPLEELYDTQTDPHEIHNLVADPHHVEKLQELREVHAEFLDTYGDLGMIPETELIRKLWPPDGKQPTTATPMILPHHRKIALQCGTPGASIAYRVNGEGRWLLYDHSHLCKGCKGNRGPSHTTGLSQKRNRSKIFSELT